MNRTRYTPRLTWRPLVRVRWRHMGETITETYRTYLFGLLPLWSTPR